MGEDSSTLRKSTVVISIRKQASPKDRECPIREAVEVLFKSSGDKYLDSNPVFILPFHVGYYYYLIVIVIVTEEQGD